MRRRFVRDEDVRPLCPERFVREGGCFYRSRGYCCHGSFEEAVVRPGEKCPWRRPITGGGLCEGSSPSCLLLWPGAS